MSPWVWVIAIAGALLALILLFVVIGSPARRRAAKREKAEALRREAEERLKTAAGREATARQEQAAAERERLSAEAKLEEADAVDPDLPAEAANLDTRRPGQPADEAV
jgi:flagellar biosynthesis/type III secretory pathway M-ring protein FliF/YscJ